MEELGTASEARHGAWPATGATGGKACVRSRTVASLYRPGAVSVDRGEEILPPRARGAWSTAATATRPSSRRGDELWLALCRRRPIHLLYSPPSHSKYNPIARWWGVME